MAISFKASIGLRRRRAWNEFLAWVDRHQEDRWIFRGVADANEHFLVPKIGRKPKVFSEPEELTIFRNFRRRARQFAPIDGLDGLRADADGLIIRGKRFEGLMNVKSYENTSSKRNSKRAIHSPRLTRAISTSVASP